MVQKQITRQIEIITWNFVIICNWLVILETLQQQIICIS